ncbi:MAG: hypothetical protein AB1515_08830 [Nitrospirota bacterium]
MNRLLRIVALISMLGVAAGPAPAAAPASPEPPQTGAGNAEPKEPAHRVLLLGATIFGTVAAPNAVYDVPWQEPFLLGRGAGDLDRNFLKEIFKPVDRDEFLKTLDTAP